MLDKNLNPESFKLIMVGTLIGVMTYLVSTYVTNYYVKEARYRVSFWMLLLMLLGSFVTILFTSLLVAAEFIVRTENNNGEYAYSSTVEWFDVMIPMLIVSFSVIIFRYWKRNREIYKFWERDDHPIIDVEQRRKERLRHS